MNKLSTYFSPIVALIIIFIIWEFLVNLFSIQLYILPAPTDIFLSLNDNLSELLLATLNTLKITLFAFLIATLIAIGLAIIFSSFNFHFLLRFDANALKYYILW